jgi:hypothetical protein
MTMAATAKRRPGALILPGVSAGSFASVIVSVLAPLYAMTREFPPILTGFRRKQAGWVLVLSVVPGLLMSHSAGAQNPLRWQHLSSNTGELPVPPGSDQQTLCLLGDLDRDGRADFVIGCRNRGPSMVWFRRVGMIWTPHVLDAEDLSIEAGGVIFDVDGDGNPDVIAGEDSRSHRLYWWENPHPDYDPTRPWRRRVIKTGGGNQHHDQIVGDFDGDGKPELVFWNQRAEKLFLAPIPADPTVEPWPLREIFSGAGEGLASGDIDGDGRPELLAGGRWFKPTGRGRFASYLIDPAQTHPRIAVGDLNGDGRNEVVMVPGDGIGRLKWYSCSGDPARTESWTGHDLLGFDVKHGHSMDVADVNGDGRLDIFCAEMRKWTREDDNPQAKMWLFLGDGKGGFTSTEIATGYGAHEARLGDIDGDGRLDVLVKPYNWDTPRLDVWLNRG